MSVVSLLAHKHGINVTLSSGNPGLIVDVILPPALFGPIDAAQPAPEPVVVVPAAVEVAVDETPIVEWEEEDRPVAQGDLRAMTLNLAAFQTGMRSATEPVEVDEVSGVAGDAEGVSEDHLTPTEAVTETEVVESEVVEVDEVEAPAPVPAAFAAPTLPPPTAARAEFAVPPAPPLTATGPSLRPVTPDNARTVPRPVTPEPLPSLPTRSPSQGPDGGPDRLASALDAALPTRSPSQGPDGGPDRLAGGAPMPLDAPDGSLPHRARVGDPLDPVEEPLATNQSTSDPEALRDRLRAFQAEFRSALGTDALDREGEAQLDHIDHTGHDGHDQFDLGGDRR
jgi:hypothetical protein